MINLRTILSKRFGIGGRLVARNQERRVVALLSVLSKMIEPAKLETVVSELQDKRFLIEELAKQYGVDPEKLLGEIAMRAGLEAVYEVPTVDLDKLAQLGRSLGEFAAAGAIPVIALGQVDAVICIDPKTVQTMINLPSTVRYRLSTWSNISAGLEASLREHELRQRELQRGRAEKLASLAKKALVALVGEVSSYQRSSFSIHFAPDLIAYEFHTAAGKRAQGTINPHVSTALKELLTRGVLEGKIEVQASDNSDPVKLKISGDPSCFRIRWGIEALKEDAPAKPFEQVSQTGAAAAVARVAVSSSEESGLREIATLKETKSRTDDPLVLVVDDNPTFGTVVQRFLERHGCRTTYAGSGAQALKLLAEESLVPDLIVCDVHMPEMNGFALVKKVREHEDLANTPVVMLTSDDDAETEIRLISDGADSFVAKNEDPRVLWAHVNRLLDRKARTKEAA